MDFATRGMGTSSRSRRSHVLGVFFGRDQFVVAAADKLQQVVQELGDIGGADVVFEMQFADAAAQVDPEILVVENAEVFVDALAADRGNSRGRWRR